MTEEKSPKSLIHPEIEKRIDKLLYMMTIEEKAGQLNQVMVIIFSFLPSR